MAGQASDGPSNKGIAGQERNVSDLRNRVPAYPRTSKSARPQRPDKEYYMITGASRQEQVERIGKVLDGTQYKDWEIGRYERNDHISFRVEAKVVDVFSKKVTSNFGPLHRIPLDAAEHVILSIVYQAIRETELHEVAEHFHYAGVRVFDPHVYVSYANSDCELVRGFWGQSSTYDGEMFHGELSVREEFTSERAARRRERLTSFLRCCTTTLVHLSSAAFHDPWVQWELEMSRRLGKRVVGAYVEADAPLCVATAPGFEGTCVVLWQDVRSVLMDAAGGVGASGSLGGA